MKTDKLIEFYQGLAPEGIARFPEFYSADAYFKDPFNEVRGVAAIQRIFTHMFEQVAEPRFIVTEKVVDDGGVMLIWTFSFRSARRGCACSGGSSFRWRCRATSPARRWSSSRCSTTSARRWCSTSPTCSRRRPTCA